MQHCTTHGSTKTTNDNNCSLHPRLPGVAWSRHKSPQWRTLLVGVCYAARVALLGNAVPIAVAGAQQQHQALHHQQQVVTFICSLAATGNRTRQFNGPRTIRAGKLQTGRINHKYGRQTEPIVAACGWERGCYPAYPSLGNAHRTPFSALAGER